MLRRKVILPLLCSLSLVPVLTLLPASASATDRSAQVTGVGSVASSSSTLRQQKVQRVGSKLRKPGPVARLRTTPPAAPLLGPLRDEFLPVTIAADCSVDVASAVNQWLASLPREGVRALLPQDGCLLVSRELTWSDRVGVVLDGRGSVLRRTEVTPLELQYPRNNRHLSVVRSTDVVVRNVRVTGLNTVSDVPNFPDYGRYLRALEFEHAFSVWASSRVLLEDLEADAIFGDGVYLHSDVTDVTVQRVVLNRNGRQGIAVLASRVIIDSATIKTSRRAGIDIEPDLAPIEDVEVRNSTVGSHLLAFASGGAGNVNRVYLHHNTVTKTGVPFVFAARDGFTRDSWTITDNKVLPVLGSSLAAIRLWNAAGAVVERNVIPVSYRQSRLIFDLSGSTVEARCNHFPGAVDDLGYSASTSSTLLSVMNTTGDQPPACLAG